MVPQGPSPSLDVPQDDVAAAEAEGGKLFIPASSPPTHDTLHSHSSSKKPHIHPPHPHRHHTTSMRSTRSGGGGGGGNGKKKRVPSPAGGGGGGGGNRKPQQKKRRKLSHSLERYYGVSLQRLSEALAHDSLPLAKAMCKEEAISALETSPAATRAEMQPFDSL